MRLARMSPARSRQRGLFALPAGLGIARAQVPWTPANLTVPPYNWLNDETALTTSGSSVSQWNDKAGSSRHAVQATAGAQPTVVANAQNGRRAIAYDGTTDFMTLNSTASIFDNASSGYCFYVFKKAALDGAAVERSLLYVNNGTTSGNARFFASIGYSGNANRLRLACRRLDADGAGIVGGATLADTNYHMALFLMDWANGDGFLYFDGNAPSSNLVMTSAGNTSNTASLNPVAIGRLTAGTPTAYADVQMGEIVTVRNGVPSATEIDKLFGYAAHRWGLTGNLPALHPHKVTPPTV